MKKKKYRSTLKHFVSYASIPLEITFKIDYSHALVKYPSLFSLTHSLLFFLLLLLFFPNLVVFLVFFSYMSALLHVLFLSIELFGCRIEIANPEKWVIKCSTQSRHAIALMHEICVCTKDQFDTQFYYPKQNKKNLQNSHSFSRAVRFYFLFLLLAMFLLNYRNFINKCYPIIMVIKMLF